MKVMQWIEKNNSKFVRSVIVLALLITVSVWAHVLITLDGIKQSFEELKTSQISYATEPEQSPLEATVQIDAVDQKLATNEGDERVVKHGLDKMSPEQLDRLVEIYAYADRVSEYGLTLTAIAWKESRGSRYPVNLDDPSCGPFHNKVSNVLAREKIEVTPFNKNVVCAKLMRDLPFAVKHANMELNVWRTKHRGNWRKMVESYNSGHGENKSYAEDIAEIVDILRTSNIDRLSEL